MITPAPKRAKDQTSLNGATVYLGDALDILADMPDGLAHCIITDPPYSSGARQDAQKSTRGAMKRADHWDEEWIALDNLSTWAFVWFMRAVATECFRVTTHPAAAHVWIDWRMYPHLWTAWESAGWTAKTVIVWDKQSPGLGQHYRGQHEFCLYLEKGVVPFQHHSARNVYQARRPTTEEHPTPKPTSILREFILATTDQDQIVLDPFCGSGTTLRAAIDEHRRAIGIELDPKHYRTTIKNMRQMVLTPTD